MARTITYETQDCRRCGGSGHYSYNPKDGSRCYGCGGTGRALTPAARKARKALDALRDEVYATEAEYVTAGDVIFDGYTRRWRTVESVEFSERTGMVVGTEYGPDGRITKPGECLGSWSVNYVTRVGGTQGVSLHPGQIVKRMSTEAREAVFALAETLAGVTVTEEEK